MAPKEAFAKLTLLPQSVEVCCTPENHRQPEGSERPTTEVRHARLDDRKVGQTGQIGDWKVPRLDGFGVKCSLDLISLSRANLQSHCDNVNPG